MRVGNVSGLSLGLAGFGLLCETVRARCVIVGAVVGIRTVSMPDVRREVKELQKDTTKLAARLLEKELKGPKSTIPVDTGFMKSQTEVADDLSYVRNKAKYARYVNKSRRHKDFLRKAVLKAWPRVAKKVNRG